MSPGFSNAFLMLYIYHLFISLNVLFLSFLMFYLFTILISVFVAIYQNKYNSEYYTQKMCIIILIFKGTEQISLTLVVLSDNLTIKSLP